MSDGFPGGGTCWCCGAALGALDYGRQDSCPQCGRDTRACKGCIHFDPSANNQCRENQADRVVDKERANFCDYFKPASKTVTQGPTPKDAARAAADALFGKKKSD